MLAAIAAAVVGPPTFALEASTTSLKGKRSARPSPTATAKCTPTCRAECAKREGASRATIPMSPIAPVAAKKNCTPGLSHRTSKRDAVNHTSGMNVKKEEMRGAKTKNYWAGSKQRVNLLVEYK